MKIGNDFKVPKKYTEFKTIDIGGYKVISSQDQGILVQGIQLLNLFQMPISEVGIIPLDEEMMGKIEKFPFEIEKHHLVYDVTFNGYAWYFNSKQEAYEMLDLILRVKENALHQKFIDDHSHKEGEET